MLSDIGHQDLNGFTWLNEPEEYKFEGSSLQVVSGKETDFFNNPSDQSISDNAPFLYTTLQGDFVATALVRPNFSSRSNAASLMVYMDSTHWMKLAFEKSDATGKSIVSVVTKEISDDANGVVLNACDSIWLRIIKKGDVYAMHWSKDGKNFKMARIFTMPYSKEVKVGMESQCPVGNAARHEFLYFSIEKKTINDLRKGE
jgi:regulation of enolase protein 1 (concanavalin A-like superfamily)